ncbi:MAG: hypothetical protein IJX85_04435 [Lachnospiraceae bacterium]|nr:hypothetical protein [Lachnospiraceae bacterium]
MLCVEIDELTACLKDAKTGEILSTKVSRIFDKNMLKKFNTRSGWYVNWGNLLKEKYEIYALYVDGDEEVQGLVALTNSPEMQAVFIDWVVSAPHNNKAILEDEQKKYIGVGGHLFAVAIEKSFEFGWEGVVTGNPANEKLMDHYITNLGAIPIRTYPHYQIMIDEDSAIKIKEVYDYEWK